MLRSLFVVILVLFSVVSSELTINFNVKQNEQQLHTSEYKVRNNVNPDDSARMIVRRGAPFVIEIQSKTVYSFTLVPFNPITLAKESNTIRIPTNTSSTSWRAVAASTSTGIKYTIYSPASSQIGIFYWGVVDPSGSLTMLTNQLVVLFNPWSSNDEVYYSDANALSEYIVNAQTLIWVGSTNNANKIGWVYDQFHYDVLEVSLYFISQLDWTSRGSAIHVSRHLSSWINVNDNDGLVWGRWQEPYTGGKTPTYWTGSLEIFQKYRKVQQGVKYGQCWVFGGCLTTAGRTLGIPARTITNFDSAHEEQSSGPDKYRMEIDMFYDKNGQYLGMEGGSIWNFHVWCEFWMSRQDLDGADGWQTVDATPQELSDGLFQLGPASIAEVRNKEVTAQYDTDFVTSEVGAAIYQWAQYNTGKQKNPDRPGFWLLDINNDGTGHLMSTKAIGKMTREDITSNYKQTAFTTFIGYGRHKYQSEAISFEIVAPDVVNIGDNITISIVAQCPGCGPNSYMFLQIAGDIRIVSYVGDVIAILHQGLLNVSLDAPETTHSIIITADEYQNYLGMNRLVEYNAFIQFYENGTFTGQYANRQGHVAFAPPVLAVLPNYLPGNQSSVLSLSVFWSNPLDIELTETILRLSGAYVSDQDYYIGTVDPMGKVWKESILFEHWTPEGEEIVVFAKLLTNELSPINGKLELP
eukprot:TRINITY_DN653_c0_g1_i1.p1 TRINITY_DN653_c0_g1~~TRINITY_DN653_c0_g1_i1.p1  ORF type:complete len:693 (+),score=127.69 TRINITY_DN653_c0_g1_i1:58-2136(+)